MASSQSLDDDEVYWVLARRLCDSSWVKMKSDKLYVTTFDKMYWPFAPENPDDFHATTEYGVITKNNMVLHYILYMSAIESDIDDAIQTGKDVFGKRIVNPKRLRNRRSAPSTVPLAHFTQSSAIEGAKATMKSTVASKQAAEDAHNNIILEESLKKKKTGNSNYENKHKDNSKPSSRLEGRGKDGNSSKHSKLQSSGKGNTSKETTKNKPESRDKNGKWQTIEKTSKQQNDAEMMMDQSTTPSSSNKDSSNRNLIGSMDKSGTKQGTVATETPEVQRLKELVEKMRKEKEEAEEKLRQTMASQASQKSVTTEDLKVLASQLSKQIMSKVKTLAIPSAAGSSGGAELNLLKNAINPENPAPDDIEPDEIFMGSERPLKRCDVLSVQRNIFKFPSRVKQLVNLLWGQDNVHKYYSTNDDNDNKLIISKDAVTCITNILLFMKWTSTDKPARGISEKTVKREIGKYTSEQRSLLKNKAKSTEEREALKKRIIENKRKRKGKKRLYCIRNGRRVKLDTEESEQDNNSDDNASVGEDNGSDLDSGEDTGSNSEETNYRGNEDGEDTGRNSEERNSHEEDDDNNSGAETDNTHSRAEESFDEGTQQVDIMGEASSEQVSLLDDRYVTKSRGRRRPPGYTEDIMWSEEMELQQHQLKKMKFGQGRNLLNSDESDDSSTDIDK